MPCASASLNGPASTFPQFGFWLRSVMPHFMLSAKPASTGLLSNTWGLLSRDVRGGRSDDGAFFVPMFHRAMFCGAERNSIHFQAASWFLLCERITRLSPAIVVAHWLPAVSVGSGATAHLPLIFG